jgi:hypothetical protein
MDASTKLKTLADRWADARPAERANAQSYLRELAEALGVEPPRPSGSGYEFEYAVRVVSRDGTETTNFIDLYKAGHFALEAKDEEPGRSPDLLLRKAFGQIRSYIGHLPDERPPYLLVLDVAKTMVVWDRWSGEYGGYSAGQRIDLRSLDTNSEAIVLLRDIWEDPAVRDPRAHAARVTKELAGQLAQLAAALEDRGHDQEQVARFLIRCVFTMFAEDVGLLPDEPFRQLIDRVALAHPEQFAGAIEDLWRAMDEGKRFGAQQLLRFNGHFFHEAKALPLTREDLTLLLEASRVDWKDVEPSIFGTLLVRALEPEERHRLGAEFTPREYVERLARPTVEEPIRERWTLVQAAVLQLRESGKPKDKATAIERLREFHAWLRGLRFLDPACGSGNFLYVTLHAVKRIELEVVRLLEELAGAQQALRLEEVGPGQFHGIEVKPWAREIAELTLWIGFHQFWRQHHDVQPPEPILQDTGTLECRDAVLAWDSIRHDPARDRLDPTPRIRSAVTGELVPDPAVRLRYDQYEGARPAPWPEADFIIGNPPYIGNKRMRETLGDGYVDALRAAYPEVTESADYVMYWWHRAAEAVASGRAIRAGLITTKAITQINHRPIIAAAAARGAMVAWVIPDHPWVDEVGEADVRVAMTVIAKEPQNATRVEVDDTGRIRKESRVPRLNVDLTAHADVAGAAAEGLHANEGMSLRGFTLVGRGFVLEAEEAQEILNADERYREVIRPYLNGRDLASRPRGVYVIDFGLGSEEDARAYPVAYDLVRDRVRPDRAASGRASYARLWWRFGEPRRELREAVTGLQRYIATPYVARHRFFTFVPASVAPDEKLVVVASDNSYLLGVLSSRIHEAWALAAGSRLGVGNDPTYNNSRCFDPFPFPDASAEVRGRIADVAERLDKHRKDALARGRQVTMTGMYNVVAKLRSGEALDEAEQKVHTLAACGVLRDLHDELDTLVAHAYGWSWPEDSAVILERLVALHEVRVEEERKGMVRWLRPDYQRARFGQPAEPAEALPLTPGAPAPAVVAAADGRPWPRDAVGQIGALRQLVAAGPLSAEEAAQRFTKAKPEIVARHLETLAILGELQRSEDGRYHEVLQPA